MAWLGVSIPWISTKPEAKSAASSGSDARAVTKPKPCCVCKDEKSKRDECMLFSKAADPTSDCKTTIDEYRTCMAGFGFQV
ncbi:cytochrome C oxidase copper chaperone-domain-containing protein [Annulohypoxylon maeteangense]|uniref:cytochrome C oxidase copper chaperone-domain-containing protein n=1 Tax=Annulohypoxylon maeteangense TaxID=1927788 RepID=UPI0020088432|nr:cytochrome C oxidase copper chaperone-domain-containing protein [Annulohypoxylon maeteangense]KAI0889685.1 cytochrome C oxidase copper chaperone-domain-containing protein [Annulohypoxylon maeteangense]